GCVAKTLRGDVGLAIPQFTPPAALVPKRRRGWFLFVRYYGEPASSPSFSAVVGAPCGHRHRLCAQPNSATQSTASASKTTPTTITSNSVSIIAPPLVEPFMM